VKPSDEQVQVITSVSTGFKKDQSDRTRTYLWSMGIRTGCFVAAIVTTGWVRWAMVAGAVFLPYIAVVIANAGRESGLRQVSSFVPFISKALPPSPEKTQ
jgi:fatty acid desaturase